MEDLTKVLGLAHSCQSSRSKTFQRIYTLFSSCHVVDGGLSKANPSKATWSLLGTVALARTFTAASSIGGHHC